jgi:hypothetical protein
MKKYKQFKRALESNPKLVEMMKNARVKETNIRKLKTIIRQSKKEITKLEKNFWKDECLFQKELKKCYIE